MRSNLQPLSRFVCFGATQDLKLYLARTGTEDLRQTSLLVRETRYVFRDPFRHSLRHSATPIRTGNGPNPTIAAFLEARCTPHMISSTWVLLHCESDRGSVQRSHSMSESLRRVASPTSIVPIGARPFHLEHPCVFSDQPVFPVHTTGRAEGDSALMLCFSCCQCASNGESWEWPRGVRHCSE